MKKRTLLLFLVAILLVCAAFAGAAQAPAKQARKAPAAAAPFKVVALHSQSPLVTFRVVFRTGSAYDPADKPGLAYLTAAMIAEGGTKAMTRKEIVEAMFPMATSLSSQVDKEMVVFGGATHIDNLDKYYALLRSMLLDPGWREDDFKRVKDDTVNFLRVSLRGNNDEELGKEVLYNDLYQGHPYGHYNAGTASAIQSMTLADLQRFYKENFTQANLVLGIAGGYTPSFLSRVEKDFATLPKGTPAAHKFPPPQRGNEPSMTIVEKDTRSVAYSIGFPIDVKRGDPDYTALLVMQSYLGQHRSSSAHLYQRIREQRGLNYGDYAYIEYFPQGGNRMEPPPNLARTQQIFQIWVRPVEPVTAHFTLRLALYELDRLVKNGLTEEEFQATRSFLSKNVNVLTRTKSAELGYAIDSAVYGIPNYNGYIKQAMAKLTREDVNRAIRKHLGAPDLHIVMVAKNAQQLREAILANAPSPIKYNSPKPEAILNEDKVVGVYKINLKPEAVKIVPVGTIFE